MKTAAKLKYDYIPVTELERGDTVVNLGIVKTIFPYKDIQQTWIKFEPYRGLNSQIMKFLDTDKLMIA
jgi:hypothetical protein